MLCFVTRKGSSRTAHASTIRARQGPMCPQHVLYFEAPARPAPLEDLDTVLAAIPDLRSHGRPILSQSDIAPRG